MSTLKLTASLTALLLLPFSGCSDDDNSSACPPCAAGMVCNSQTGACVPEQQDCGPNSTNSDGCVCELNWFDCNGDLGQSGGDGCECNGVCENGVCDTSATPECSPLTENDCGDSSQACIGGKCVSCEGKYNCDGKFACECDEGCNETACDVSTPQDCSTEVVNDCGSKGLYCNAGVGKCAPCPEMMSNCDGLGTCECNGDCNDDDGTCNDYSTMSCFDLELAYGGALTDARECDPAATPDPCTYVVTGDITCGCNIWVNAGKTEAIATMEHVKAAALEKSCSYTCPPGGCADYTSASCESLPSSGGECTYH